jgi:Cu/Ag efflux protein CusF
MNLKAILTATALGLLAPAFAQSTQGPAATSTATPEADGEVRKIDKEQGKLTLKHGPLPNLDMPGMTMVFKVADPALLEPLKVGDKVKFAAENRNGALTVTAIKPAP